MKADGTSEGKGVHFVNSIEEAKRFFAEYSESGGVPTLLKKLLLNRDWDWVTFDWRHSQRSIIAQTAIQGRPANCAVACWQGNVLAAVAVEAVRTRGTNGPATLVQIVEGEGMIAAAKTIARRLGRTGFFGLDFVIENDTGIPYLIEMNPRCTPPCVLPLEMGCNLVTALWSQISGRQPEHVPPLIKQRYIAYFPGTGLDAGRMDQATHREGPVHLDMPKDEPELIKALLAPRPSRTVLGRLVDRVKGKKQEIRSIDVKDAAESALNPLR
jgi:predicted ATP-grasp superfamily ATP-dependent carboligase